MAGKFLDLAFTNSVRTAQQDYYGHARELPPQPARDPLSDEEIEFIHKPARVYTDEGQVTALLAHTPAAMTWPGLTVETSFAKASLRRNRT